MQIAFASGGAQTTALLELWIVLPGRLSIPLLDIPHRNRIGAGCCFRLDVTAVPERLPYSMVPLHSMKSTIRSSVIVPEELMYTLLSETRCHPCASHFSVATSKMILSYT